VVRDGDKRIDRVFHQAAEDSPDKTHLLIPGGTAITYAETYCRAQRLAEVLVRGGIKPGDRVASMLRNSRELVEFFVACGLCGGIGVAINTFSTQREAGALLMDCTPSALLTSEEFLAVLSPSVLPASVGLKLLAGGATAEGWQAYDDALGEVVPPEHDVWRDPEEPALIIYSSGTTGKPKGIVLSHRSIIDNGLCACPVLGYNAEDRFLTLLPLFSSFGFAFDLLHAAMSRASTVLMGRFDEDCAVDLVERFRVTFLAGVPTMFARMFDAANLRGRDVASLRLIDVGGGPVSLRLKKMLRDDYSVGVVESYGLTEISPVASAQRNPESVTSSSCGEPLPGFKVRVVDADGNDLSPGQPGELLFQSGTFMLGYWNQSQETARSLRDGWLHTGDLGRVDEHGEIHILDRTKDMIVSNGFNVYPKEIENVIAELPEVESVAVVGRPDEIRGETVHAFIVLRAGKTLSEESVLAMCRESLSRFKVPRGISFIPELPLTGSGKIQRFRLRTLLEEQQLT
jgi:long-chain acyl-CoA synthetase